MKFKGISNSFIRLQTIFILTIDNKLMIVNKLIKIIKDLLRHFQILALTYSMKKRLIWIDLLNNLDSIHNQDKNH